MKKKIKIILLIAIPVILLSLVAVYFIFFNHKEVVKSQVDFLNVDEKWADSLIAEMTIEEKIGQVVFLKTNNEKNLNDSILFFIEKYKIGGAVVEQNTISDYVNLINVIQKKTQIPLFIGMETENLGFNFLTDIQNFPTQKAIYSVSEDTLQKSYANLIAQQSSKIGVHINFLNNFDILKNISEYDTTLLNFIYTQTEIYSNYFLQNKVFPCLNINNISEKDTSLLKIYNKIFKNGLPAISIENNFLEQYKNINFNGITFKTYTSEQDFESFFKENNDVLIINNNYQTIIDKLIETANSKRKYKKELDDKVKKILLAKTWLGLNNYKKANINVIKRGAKSMSITLLSRKLYEKSIILLKNDEMIIPIKNIQSKIQIIVLGENNLGYLEKSIENYKSFLSITLNPQEDDMKNRFKIYENNTGIIAINNYPVDSILINQLKKINETNNLIIVNFGIFENIEKFNDFPTVIHVYDTTRVEQEFAGQLIYGGISAKGKLPFSINNDFPFGTGVITNKTRFKYSIPEEVGIDSKKLLKIDSIINDGISRGAMPGCQVFVAKQGQVIWNKGYGFHSYGKQNPVEVTDLFDIASVTKVAATTLSAMKMVEQGRLSLNREIGNYFENTHIEYTRIKPDTILNIDTLNLNEIKNLRKILKYQDTIHLNDSIIVAYDTLIVTATPSRNIFKVTARDLLRHESGISPAVPILKLLLWGREYNKYVKNFNSRKNLGETDSIRNDSIKKNEKLLSKQEFRNRIYSNSYNKDSSEVQIAGGFYLNKSYQDTLWIDIKQIRCFSRKIYQYSDINMVLLQQTIDSINNFGIDQFVKNTFYNSLGMQTTYKPLEHFGIGKIIPTERDNFWRRQLIHGHVHDPSAALLGGISGNAGLFSSAQDLGILFQMLLNGGTYGGRKYLQESTINVFTRTQTDSYRGLGFDKWSKRQIIAKSASPNTYGHTGFTGCCVWVDPDSEIVYIFLSNRVHPSAKNWRLNSYKIRNNVHQAVYDAMIKENKDKN